MEMLYTEIGRVNTLNDCITRFVPNFVRPSGLPDRLEHAKMWLDRVSGENKPSEQALEKASLAYGAVANYLEFELRCHIIGVIDELSARLERSEADLRLRQKVQGIRKTIDFLGLSIVALVIYYGDHIAPIEAKVLEFEGMEICNT